MEAPASLAALRTAARAPIEAWPALYPGHRAVGSLCSYVPEDLIAAAGFSPLRVRAMHLSAGPSDSHLPAYACALCKGVLGHLAAGELSHLAGLVFAHTCDTMQAMSDICPLEPSAPGWVETVMLPASLHNAASHRYLAAELVRFRERLELHAGRPLGNSDLVAGIVLCDETRRLVQAFCLRRECLSAADFYAVLDAAQVMPRALLNPLLSALLSELDALPPRPRGPRLFLSGAVLDEPRLLTMVDELGAQVTGDNLCTGPRRFLGQVGTSGDPITRLVRHLLERDPCPCKRQSPYDPAKALLEQVRQSGASGVLFLLQKYCEPHAFELAIVRPALEQAGIPHLLLELEQGPSIEAIRTRLQAFLEML